MIDYPLTPCEDVEELQAEVRRVGGALLDDALERVVRPDDAGEAVHESRKRLKEARALLRLVKSSLVDADGRSIRGRENDAYRAAANALGHARDAAVLVDTLDLVKKRFADEFPPRALATLRRRLVKRHEKTLEQGVGFDATREILEDARGRIDDWHLDAKSAWKAMRDDVGRIYAKGQKAMAHAVGSDDAEDWHEWRKRAKDLRYALELLRESAPDLIGQGACDAAKSLTDYLGDDHDLAVFAQTLHDEPDLCDDATRTAATAVADLRSGELRDKARDLGRRVYAESADAFVKRIGAYWKSAAKRREALAV